MQAKKNISVIVPHLVYRVLFLLALGNFYISFLSAAPKRTAKFSVVVSNPSALARVGEVVSIDRDLFGKVDDRMVPAVAMKNRLLESQQVDADNNGAWDRLLVAINLHAHAKDTLEITWADTAPATFGKVANIRLSLRSLTDTPTAEIYAAVRYRGFSQDISKPYYQMEGPGIENDKVAFRAFFDYRNGMDIYGKITPGPVLQQVGVGASWHALQPWGMDILKVGNSLGAGALAVRGHNRFYRLADADTSIYKKLYTGCLLAAFKLSFKNWDVGHGVKNGNETISMSKGDYFYKNEIEVPLDNDQELVSGIANFINAPVRYQKYKNGSSSISTYGPQAEGTATNLGLAILFKTAAYTHHATTDTASIIPNTSYVAMKANNKYTLYFFACWQQTDAVFSTKEGFQNYLDNAAERLANPILVQFINKQ